MDEPCYGGRAHGRIKCSDGCSEPATLFFSKDGWRLCCLCHDCREAYELTDWVPISRGEADVLLTLLEVMRS